MRIRIARWGLLPLAVGGLAFVFGGMSAAMAAKKPAFCKSAKNSAERAICFSAELIALDAALNDVYTELKTLAPEGEFAAIRGEQRHWLNARNRCGSYVDCLKRTYQDRLSVLEHAAEGYAFPNKSHVEIGMMATCDGLGSLTTPNVEAPPVTLTFTNRSGEYRSVMWIDFEGQPKNYANLNPGEAHTVRTFDGHIWMFTDGPGNCIEMYTAVRSKARFDITTPSPGFGPE